MIPWITAQNPLDAHPYSAQHAVLGDRFAGVMRAGWRKSAGRREQRTYQVLIDTDQLDYQLPHFN
jgi:hypothetical protein